jgi:phosphonopyruvate decarboxylase
MMDGSVFINSAAGLGIRMYSGVPCSYLKPLINYVIESPDLTYVGAANEGEAVGFALGAALAGKRSAVLLQNSGLGNAVNPLTSLCAAFRVPVLLLCTWRGQPDGAPDEPQHDLMGRITVDLLRLLAIPCVMFPEREADLEPVLIQALAHMDRSGGSYAIILRKNVVNPPAGGCVPRPMEWHPRPQLAAEEWPDSRPSRREVLSAVQHAAGDSALIATTGYTGRCLYELEDNERQLYAVGGMGCASSIALGLAMANPSRRVVVLDGDGAALMRLGAFSMIGRHRPGNLTHIVLDNEIHESTGGQATLSRTTDLSTVAWACGYARVVRAFTADAVAYEIRNPGRVLTFIHVKVRAGYEQSIPRPAISPPQVAARFRSWFSNGC